MTDSPEVEQYKVVNRVHGEMISHSAARLFVRDFPEVVSDEPPSRGGVNRGSSPLGYILIALCA